MPQLYFNGDPLMTFIITGGSSGIGQALARSLADRNKEVLICARREAPLKRLVEYAPNYIRYVAGDLTEDNTLNKIQEALNGLQPEGLIQNAGQIGPIMPIASMSISAYEKNHSINVTTPIRLFQRLEKELAGGRVLQLSSLAAHVPFASWGAYCMSKSSLHMLYQLLKKECSTIHFGSVMPGITDTAMQSLIRESSDMPPKDRQFFIDLKKNNKLLKPSVVASFLTWLLLEVPGDVFSHQEWDIYDTSHHKHWLLDGEACAL